METPEKNSAPEFLNEQSVSLLESHWRDLRAEATAEATQDGWAVRLVPGARLFPKAGFKAIEKISAMGLLRHARTGLQKGLVERLLAILEHLGPAKSNA
ncbi:hypothetical protein K2X33_12630 [bacterium]|nr:hypothetical protein [bacterium]